MSEKNKNQGKFKKEKIYKKIKDYYLKIALTGDNKLLFRCYDTNNFDCICYQLIKSADEIFDLYEDMKMYENSSVLYNVITNMFDLNCSIDYDKSNDIILIETSNLFSYKKKIRFKLHKENITCIKEYVFLLGQSIKQLKEDSTEFKKTKKNFDSEYYNIKKIPSLLEDIKKLKDEMESLRDILVEKEKKIDSLSKLTEKNTTEINIIKDENKNLKVAMRENQEEIEEINKKIKDNKTKKQKMTVNYFNITMPIFFI